MVGLGHLPTHWYTYEKCCAVTWPLASSTQVTLPSQLCLSFYLSLFLSLYSFLSLSLSPPTLNFGWGESSAFYIEGAQPWHKPVLAGFYPARDPAVLRNPFYVRGFHLLPLPSCGCCVGPLIWTTLVGAKSIIISFCSSVLFIPGV